MAEAFAGRRVAVTGGAEGIGRALVDALLAEGAAVAIIDRARVAAPPSGAVAVEADLVTAAACGAAVEAAHRGLGGLDSLVNVAGIYPVTPALEIGEAEWDAVLDLNLKAPFFCSQAFARQAEGEGRIVMVGSTAGAIARPGIAHYGASKAGLAHLTRVLALEWAPRGIRVNAVAPGVIETRRVVEFNDTAVGARESAAKRARVPMGRFGTPEEAVEICMFLLGGASYVTGAVFTVDGGYSLGLPSYD
jgi:NAD(P)-dependent dehydrogenase (short-subunit alcohol dehydrogenase family)